MECSVGNFRTFTVHQFFSICFSGLPLKRDANTLNLGSSSLTNEDTLHEISKPVFWKKKKNQNVICENITQHAKH